LIAGFRPSRTIQLEKTMNVPKSSIITAIVLLLLTTHVFIAAGEDNQEMDTAMQGMSMSSHQGKDIFLVKKQIDEYTVSFHVMKVTPDIHLAGSHNFMVKIENQNGIVGNAVVNSKIIFPSGKSESKFLDKMGDWYMKDYNLAENGKYQLLILFKTADGKKHKGGVYYEQSNMPEEK